MTTIADVCEIVSAWDKTDEEWREARKDGIGGSEIGTILGLNKYEDAYTLWCIKSKLTQGFQGNEATEWGHDLERPVAQNYARKYNKAVVEWPVMLRNKKRPLMKANLDFVAVKPSEQFPAGVVTLHESLIPPADIIHGVEIKTSGLVSPGNPKEWFLDSVDDFIEGGGAPDGYVLQTEWYEGVTEVIPSFELVGLIAGHGLQVRTIHRNDTLIDDLYNAAVEFWDRVVNLDAPAPSGLDSTEETLKERYPKALSDKVYEGGETLRNLWDEFEIAKKAASTADESRKALRSRIAELMADAEIGTVDGEPILSYKNNKDGTKFDETAFKAKHPDLHVEFQKAVFGARVLRGL